MVSSYVLYVRFLLTILTCRSRHHQRCFQKRHHWTIFASCTWTIHLLFSSYLLTSIEQQAWHHNLQAVEDCIQCKCRVSVFSLLLIGDFKILYLDISLSTSAEWGFAAIILAKAIVVSWYYINYSSLKNMTYVLDHVRKWRDKTMRGGDKKRTWVRKLLFMGFE